MGTPETSTLEQDYERLKALTADVLDAVDRMKNGSLSLRVSDALAALRAHVAHTPKVEPADDAAAPRLEAGQEAAPAPESPAEPAPAEAASLEPAAPEAPAESPAETIGEPAQTQTPEPTEPAEASPIAPAEPAPDAG